MQFTPRDINQNAVSDEEIICVLKMKYGMCESEARALNQRELRIRIAALDFLANNLPESAPRRD
ncbi:MAG TPA: hypothetical protein VFS47_02100 [Steroidobacteraceae bacterium]|jgi:hypothetical protein|nr:hypothetical protein [Steroidobacteraceae bacterium]